MSLVAVLKTAFGLFLLSINFLTFRGIGLRVGIVLAAVMSYTQSQSFRVSFTYYYLLTASLIAVLKTAFGLFLLSVNFLTSRGFGLRVGIFLVTVMS